MKFDYDVAIVGLGPAGSTLARLLDKHFKVVAIDKKRIADGGFKKDFCRSTRRRLSPAST